MALNRVALLALALLLPATELAAQRGANDSALERARERDDERERERERDRDEGSRVTYSVIGLSRLSADFENVEEAVSLDAGLGFRIPDVSWFTVQLDIGVTIIPGEVESVSFTESDGGGGSLLCGMPLQPPCPTRETRQTRSQQDFQARNLGVYAVVRTPGRFYATGRVGYRYSNTTLPDLEDDRSGRAYGGGFGYRYGTAGGYAELGYLRLSDDLDSIGFSLGYGFGGNED